MDIQTSGYIDSPRKNDELISLIRELTNKIQSLVHTNDLMKYSRKLPVPYEEIGIKVENTYRMWQVYRDDYVSTINILDSIWRVNKGSGVLKNFKLTPSLQVLVDRVSEAIVLYQSEVVDKMKAEEKLRSIESPEMNKLLAIWPNDEAMTQTKKMKLDQSSYDAANGILNIHGEKVRIIKQSNKKGLGRESKRAALMRALFSVKTFPNAVPIRQIYPVKSDVYPETVIKRANSLVTDINKQIQEKLPVEKVINHDKFKFYIEDRYLI